LKRGATGQRVRELHDRLFEVGHVSMTDSPNEFGEETVALVEAFQRAKGLAITGDVDEVTWARLVEAGWRLGQRLLYLDRPYLRGDDVAELQVRLAQLGFNPGRIDGIFGPLLEDALGEFQRNCGLEVNATLTRRTLLELTRVTPSVSDRHLVNEARDVAGFLDDASGPIVLCGTSPLRALLEDSLHFWREVVSLPDTTALEVATFANQHEAVVVLSLDQVERGDGFRLNYWASYRSHSRRGEMLASALASALAKSNVASRVEVAAMALPILRETRMTTLHVEHGPQERDELQAVSDVVTNVLVEVFHR
jgi:N-acetylmuramoyl-L-alanine amidase